MNTHVIFKTIKKNNGTIGHILLNRPQALNALSLPMLQSLHSQLAAWKSDATISAVMIEGAGDRAFCAGGDIRAVYGIREEIISNKVVYFDHEYAMNELIFNYPKPYIALMDGITMGGGIGISIWGSHPIATERLSFAMPETAIGLFPDIGASYFLTRLPDYMGWYLGLTGNSINAYEALQLGLVKTIVHHSQLNHFKETLDPKHIHIPTAIDVDSHSVLLNHRQDIHDCFSQSSIIGIITALESKDEWCQSIAATLKTRSPLSLKVTFDYLNCSRHKTFHEVMALNRILVNHFLRHPEFYEGVRAAVIDKDKNPRWQHCIADVDSIPTQHFFE